MNLIAFGFIVTGLAFLLVWVWLIFLTKTLDKLVEQELRRRRERIHGR